MTPGGQEWHANMVCILNTRAKIVLCVRWILCLLSLQNNFSDDTKKQDRF